MIKLKTDRLTHLGAIAVDVGKESVLKEQLTLSLRFSSRLLCCSGLCQGDPMEEGKWSRSRSVVASKQRDGKAGRGRSPLKARPWWFMSPSRLHLLVPTSPPTPSVTSLRDLACHTCTCGGHLILKLCYMLQEIKKYFRKKQRAGEAAGIEHLCNKLNRILS